MKSIIKFYVIEVSENICKLILMNFLEKLCFEKREKINVFWKGNKTKGGNKYALLSGGDRSTTKNYITTWVFPLILFFISVIKRLFKNI